MKGLFASTSGCARAKEGKSWKVLVVDDDRDVHRITNIVVGNLTFEGRPIEIISAYSKEEAKEILKEHNDIALAIIDVVMEDKHVGLDLVRFIREELGNRYIRIVIRTGYPGYAPQKEVVLEYDINDYREKTEVSSENLVTIILSGLRSYRDIIALEHEASALKKIVKFLSRVQQLKAEELVVNEFVDIAVSVAQIYGTEVKVDLLDGADGKALIGERKVGEESFSLWKDCSTVYVVLVREGKVAYVVKIFCGDGFVGRLRDVFNILLHTFSNAWDRMVVSNELNETLKEIILTLSEVLETRSGETGEHVNRVSSIVYEMAKALGFDERTAFEWKLASMMHDIGKIGIPDAILNKPGKLTPEEFEAIKRHTIIGYEILSRSKRRIFKMAASIALNHHENWDGTGYPNGLKGEEIPLEARVTSIADVYDALSSDRVYRKAWPEEKVFEYIKENAGKKFDPALVKLFFEIVDVGV